MRSLETWNYGILSEIPFRNIEVDETHEQFIKEAPITKEKLFKKPHKYLDTWDFISSLEYLYTVYVKIK